MLAIAPDQLTPAPQRAYRWTLARQRAFLEQLAVSGSISQAATHVGVSPRAAYDLRHRRDGLLFGVGWGAAVLLARYRLTDLLLERAIDGVEEVAVRSAPAEDGSTAINRRKYDGRLGMALLSRLDRMASEAAEESPHEAALHRAVAQDFESFLDRLSPPPSPDAPNDPATGDTADAHATPADLAATHAALEADARADAQARVAAHLAAQADGLSPLARLAQDSGVHCELAQKSADPEPDQPPAGWTPPKPGEDRARELHKEIHDLLDQIEDTRARFGLEAIDIRWDSCVIAERVAELVDMEEENLMPFGVFLLDQLAPYGAAWREIDMADIDPDSDIARFCSPHFPYGTVATRREDSIKSRIDRLIATGKARAVEVAAEQTEQAEQRPARRSDDG